MSHAYLSVRTIVPHHPKYEIDINSGDIYNRKTKRKLTPFIDNKRNVKYPVYKLDNKICKAHRLVMSAIYSRLLGEKEIVCHKDSNPQHNDYRNLLYWYLYNKSI